MRLQVSVNRYSLPTTNIIFTTRALGPSPATSSPEATVAQLLEDVNDIVPLESANWGLEDYAVEVNGYECLHFSPIDAVLRDGDQVVIRALKTQDLRARRLGGRHQIGSDGRHLIDGVAFGRQWMKKGGRPAVQIPPRKRRLRIEGVAEFHEEEQAMPLALAGITDADEVASEEADEEEDSDFVDEEMDAFVNDESGGEAGPSFVIDTKPDLQIVARPDFQHAEHDTQDDSEEDDSEEDDSDEVISAEEAELELSADLQALREEECSHYSQLSGERQGCLKQVLPDDCGEIETNGRKRKLSVDHDTEDGDEIEFNGFSSPRAKRSKIDEDGARPESDSDSTTSSGSDSDEESELGVSLPLSKGLQSLDRSVDSDNLSDSSDETSSSESDSGSDTASDNDSSGSSSSSSQTSDVTTSNEEAPPPKIAPKSNFVVPHKEMTLPSVNPTISPRPPVPPGQGLRRTHYSNQRQKKRHRLKVLQAQGLLPENATFTDLAAYDESYHTANLGPAAAVAKVIEAKKQELLDQVGKQMYEQVKQHVQVQEEIQEQVGDKVLEPNTYTAWIATDERVCSTHSDPRRTETPFTGASSQQLWESHTPLHEKPAKDLINPLLAPHIETKSEPPKQRARLDLNSTRNMIFNGLGVRKPKTAAAEQALRDKLSKPVKGALPRQLFEGETMKQAGVPTTLGESQIPWQNKLILSAVECELEDVNLQDPPFPFVQGWDENANRRLRNRKTRGRNQRQYYACDEDIFMDEYGEKHQKVEDEDDTMVQNETHGDDTLDKLTTKASNLISEAREQLDTNASGLLKEEVEDLPCPSNVDNLHTLQQQDALPGAVIAYKEFHLNATTFQPEISTYRIACVEALQDDGSIDLVLSKRDRKAPTVAKYDTETGERILSRSEMWVGSDDFAEDDGRRHFSYSDLIEPKIVQASTTSKSMASVSASEKGKDPNGLDSTVNSEPMIPDSFALTSAQSPARVAIAAEIDVNVDVDVATPQRTEISKMIKEAGFNSALDSEIGQPVNGVAERARHRSPSSSVNGGFRCQSRSTSADPASEDQQLAPDTSGFDSPRFNGWSSSPPVEPEPDDVTEETGLSELPNSSQKDETRQEEAVSDESLMPKNDVPYPHISQLELDASMKERPASKLRGGSGGNSPAESPSHNNVEDAVHLDGPSIEVAAEEAHLDSLKSVVPPSIDQSHEAEHVPESATYVAATFLGGQGGQNSSDDDELPSLGRITSTARSRSSRVSPPPVTRRDKGKAARRHRSTSPYADSTAFGSQLPPTKQSQSQLRLSQIPPGSQVVDLTFSSDPVSPGSSDGDWARTKRLPRTSSKGRTGSTGGGADKTDVLAVSSGLGNRRLLKSKKAKP